MERKREREDMKRDAFSGTDVVCIYVYVFILQLSHKIA